MENTFKNRKEALAELDRLHSTGAYWNHIFMTSADIEKPFFIGSYHAYGQWEHAQIKKNRTEKTETIFIVCIKEKKATAFLKAFKTEKKATAFKLGYLKEYSHISPDMEIEIFEEVLN